MSIELIADSVNNSLCLTQELTAAGLAVIAQRKTMRFGVSEKDRPAVREDNAFVANDLPRLVLHVFDDRYHIDAESPLAKHRSGRIDVSLIAVDHEYIRQRPLEMPKPAPNDLLERSDVIHARIGL